LPESRANSHQPQPETRRPILTNRLKSAAFADRSPASSLRQLFSGLRRRRPTTRLTADPSLEIGPIAEVPCPSVSLAELANPIPALVQSPAFAGCEQFFTDCPSAARSLLSAKAQALLYATIRNFRPDHVVEIGTYKGGTTEGLARAVLVNGQGVVHTVSPFDAERFERIAAQWPAELKRQVRYHPVDSMAFFITADQERIRPGVVLVDGNHDYEFASFDIQAAAQRLQPGGFIFIDNVSQAGPYFATLDFLSRHPDWIDCAEAPASASSLRAFEDRTTIPQTDFIVLRAPFHYSVGNRPKSFGEIGWTEAPVHGLKLSFAQPPEAGMLHIQCVLRGFSNTEQAELVGEGHRDIAAGASEIDIALTAPLHMTGPFHRHLVEPWLVWPGGQPLALTTPPQPF
jgi:predicted O-methyltransferase YrrM